MSAIGYRQLIDHINGELDWSTMREEILIGNHRLIGAQNNWFKMRDERISWIDISDGEYVKKAISWVDDWLSTRGDNVRYNDRIA